MIYDYITTPLILFILDIKFFIFKYLWEQPSLSYILAFLRTSIDLMKKMTLP